MAALPGDRPSPVLLVWPAVLAGLCGAAVFNLAPLYLEAAGRRFDLDDRQLGWLMSAEIAGITLASLLVVLLRGRIAIRPLMLFGALIVAGGNLAALGVAQFNAFLVTRFFIGLFGDGLVYVTAIIALGRHHNPIWAFASLSFSNMCFSAIMLLALPMLVGDLPLATLLLLFTALGGLASTAWRWFRVDDAGHGAVSHAAGTRLTHMLALAGLAFFGANLGAVWTFAERLGESIGLATATTAYLLSVAILFQAFGSLLAMLLSRRVRATTSLLIVTIGQTVAMALLWVAETPLSYFASIAVWGASWNLGAANLLGRLSHLPNAHRAVPLAPGVEALGVTAGPLMVAAAISPGLQVSVPIIGIVTTISAVLLTQGAKTLAVGMVRP